MTAMREVPIDSPATWRADTLLDNDGLVELDTACRVEIDRTAEELAANPLPIEALKVSDVDMPACQATMASVREQLEHGIGFAVVDRLPVDRLDQDISKKLYWLLMSMTGRPVAQAWTGTMVYDVLDTGKNHAGVCRFRLQGKAGDKIVMRYVRHDTFFCHKVARSTSVPTSLTRIALARGSCCRRTARKTRVPRTPRGAASSQRCSAPRHSASSPSRRAAGWRRRATGSMSESSASL